MRMSPILQTKKGRTGCRRKERLIGSRNTGNKETAGIRSLRSWEIEEEAGKKKLKQEIFKLNNLACNCSNNKLSN